MKKQKFILYTNPNNVTSRAYTAIGAVDVRKVKKDSRTYSDSYRILFEGAGTADDIEKTKAIFSNYKF